MRTGAAIAACLILAGCTQEQAATWPASLQLVPASYYSAKPRYTSSPAASRGPQARTNRAPEPEPPRTRVQFPEAPTAVQERRNLDELEARAAEISEQLRAMRRQLE